MENEKCYTGSQNNNLENVLALFKIVYLTLIISFSKKLIEGMQIIQKVFI